jgi:CheY-like chemotaxis protein
LCAERASQYRRVLVVDAQIDEANGLTELLRQMGHYVQHAIDGYAALRISEKLRPQVAFVDLLLPGFDGPALCRRLHLGLAPHSLRVVAIGAAPREELRRRAALAGCQQFLPKPLDFRQVERLLA